MKKKFCSLRILAIFVKTHVFCTTFDIQSFWKVQKIGFKIFCMVRENFCMLQKSAPLFFSLENPHYYFPGLQNENISVSVYWDEEFIHKRDVAFQPLFGYKKVGIYQIHRNGVPKNYFFQ